LRTSSWTPYRFSAEQLIKNDSSYISNKRPTLMEMIQGFDVVMTQLTTLARIVFRTRRLELLRVGFINGLPGFVTKEADGELQTAALDIENGKLAAIYVARNPDKLRHLH
jgi:RNA polymerase sigma-70 factor, ECF subfamily